MTGYQQSGTKNFRFADPIIHKDLFESAEKHSINIRNSVNNEKYKFLLKFFDRAEIINIDEI